MEEDYCWFDNPPLETSSSENNSFHVLLHITEKNAKIKLTCSNSLNLSTAFTFTEKFSHQPSSAWISSPTLHTFNPLAFIQPNSVTGWFYTLCALRDWREKKMQPNGTVFCRAKSKTLSLNIHLHQFFFKKWGVKLYFLCTVIIKIDWILVH